MLGIIVPIAVHLLFWAQVGKGSEEKKHAGKALEHSIMGSRKSIIVPDVYL